MSDSRSTLEDIQRQLRDVACPTCGKRDFDLSLYCDFGHGECLYLAKCRTCGYTFEVSTETKRLKADHPDVDQRLAQAKCPHCGQVGADLNFRCDLTTKTCFYGVTCRACGKIFKEYRD